MRTKPGIVKEQLIRLRTLEYLKEALQYYKLLPILSLRAVESIRKTIERP